MRCRSRSLSIVIYWSCGYKAYECEKSYDLFHVCAFTFYLFCFKSDFLNLINEKGRGFIVYAKRIKAERQGFEPWVPLQVHMLSRHARSTTPASLQSFIINVLQAQKTTLKNIPPVKRCAKLQKFTYPQKNNYRRLSDKTPYSSSFLRISPLRFLRNSRRTRSISVCFPSRYISLHTAASAVISLPPSTPISYRALPV